MLLILQYNFCSIRDSLPRGDLMWAVSTRLNTQECNSWKRVSIVRNDIHIKTIWCPEGQPSNASGQEIKLWATVCWTYCTPTQTRITVVPSLNWTLYSICLCQCHLSSISYKHLEVYLKDVLYHLIFMSLPIEMQKRSVVGFLMGKKSCMQDLRGKHSS